MARRSDVLAQFSPAVGEWFRASFEAPTPPQALGWPAIAAGNSTLILAPTGSGKTLTAFLWCINRVMFDAPPPPGQRCRVLYISPLKALAVDIERNLRAPLAGIANRAVARGDAFHQPAVAIRTGDTPAVERARFLREPADILITTPESLYLLLTSNAREALRSIDTVIVDEIHALVPTKRGAHLALSLERLEQLTAPHAVQRIGLSATQRPLDEVARFLGGSRVSRDKGKGTREKAEGKRQKVEGRRQKAEDKRQTAKTRGKKQDAGTQDGSDAGGVIHSEFAAATPSVAEYRAVTVVDTCEKKKLDLRIEVPVEDMSRIGQVEEIPSGPASQAAPRQSIWSAIHPRLLELVKAHQSTLIFVNSRRIAERLAAALN
ncbi:MAG TPA: DEAD/DEAH box helicase, partial [Sphingomicrobium sp.]|nr:DEAD/DEAH box helicase [Sphingomicrobium sp.]